jgi:hypothetical protein
MPLKSCPPEISSKQGLKSYLKSVYYEYKLELIKNTKLGIDDE